MMVHRFTYIPPIASADRARLFARVAGAKHVFCLKYLDVGVHGCPSGFAIFGRHASTVYNGKHTCRLNIVT
jgi:hypothetical protein